MLEVVRQIVLQTADAEVVVHHSRAGDRLEDCLNPLPPPEAEHRRRHGAGVQSHRSHEQEMAGDAVQLAQDYPNVFRPFGHGKAHQLFHCLAIGHLVIEVGNVVQPVEQGDNLMVLLTLAKLLRTTVQIADVGLGGVDFLAVNPKHHAKNAVGRWVLRPHVEQHLHRLAADPAGWHMVCCLVDNFGHCKFLQN